VFKTSSFTSYKLAKNKTPIITEKGRLQQDRYLQQEITAILPPHTAETGDISIYSHALLKQVIYIVAG
jgi:hypothetical protein